MKKENLVNDNNIFKRLENYDLDKYIFDVENLGLEKTWDNICKYVIDKNTEALAFLDVKNFANLYEQGLAIIDKNQKKKSGKYYTPEDVAKIMSIWLQKSEGSSVCDVACGTGQLILTYLDLIGFDKARKLISDGKIYLYDFDKTALLICKTTIAKIYGLDIIKSINIIHGDFLDSNINLPNDCKVIANPPYAKMSEISKNWKQTDVVLDTNEYYSAFMEKIFEGAKSAVIITPYSFISANRFYSLREKMSNLGKGFIVSFDNVPGNIFYGKKHGIFNSNTSNAVRAAVTVFSKSDTKKGFKISPLIRFKTEERKRLLNAYELETTLPLDYQVVSEKQTKFEKIEKDLVGVFKAWKDKSKYLLKDLLSKDETKYLISMPNTCRYFTTASKRKLNRSGQFSLYFKNERDFNFIYCLINSSFAYWWWRVYDGGINYPINILKSIPIPLNLLTKEDDAFFEEMSKKLQAKEDQYIITKLNAGRVQENIKFPKEDRDKINKKILSILGFDLDGRVFNKVHSNTFFDD